MSSTELPICLICKTNHGFTLDEYLFHTFHNGFPLELYPLISLAYAFGCNCNHLCAHNRCLKNKWLCPCCARRCDKPKLTVDTKFGKRMMFVLGYFKKNPQNIKYLKWWIVLSLTVMVILGVMLYFGFIVDHDRTSGAVCGVGIVVMFSSVVPAVILEYVKKNWLLE